MTTKRINRKLLNDIIHLAAVRARFDGNNVVDVLGSTEFFNKLVKVYGIGDDGDLDISFSEEKKMLAAAKKEYNKLSYLKKNPVPDHVKKAFDRNL